MWSCRGAFLFLAIAAMWGCAGSDHHVALRAPSSSASIDERIAAYAQLSGTIERHRRAPPELRLGNGEVVDDPNDFIAVVPAESETAIDARQAAHDQHIGNVLTAAMATGFAGGTAAMVTGIITSNEDNVSRPSQALMIVAGAVALLSFITELTVGTHYASAGADERRRALGSYNESLRAQLHLCVKQLQVVDCDAPPALGPWKSIPNDEP